MFGFEKPEHTSLANLYKPLRRVGGHLFDTLLTLDNFFSNNNSLIRGPISKIDDKSIAFLAVYRLERGEYLERCKAELEKCGFLVITIVNTEITELSLPSKKDLRFTRINKGFDLGMYRDALRMVNSPHTRNTELLFLNDSIYYEKSTITQIVHLLREKKEQGVFSLVESNQHTRHLQTYFLYANLNHINLSKLIKAFEKFKNWRCKRSAVSFGEKKILGFLEEEGLPAAGLWSTVDLQIMANLGCQYCANLSSVASSTINPSTHLIHKLKSVGLDFRKYVDLI